MAKDTELPESTMVADVTRDWVEVNLKCDGCKQVTHQTYTLVIPYDYVEQQPMLGLAKRLVLCTTCGHTKLVK